MCDSCAEMEAVSKVGQVGEDLYAEPRPRACECPCREWIASVCPDCGHMDFFKLRERRRAARRQSLGIEP